MRIVIVMLAVLQVALSVWVVNQCAWGSAGLFAFCRDWEKLSEAVDDAQWKAVMGESTLSRDEDIRRAAAMYSGNRFDRLLVGVPLVCTIKCVVLIGLAMVVPRKTNTQS